MLLQLPPLFLIGFPLLQGGGASSRLTLSAYVLTSLSEVSLRSADFAPKLQQAKSKAISYLENNIGAVSDPYSLALCSYALYKAGSAKVDTVLNKLDSISKQEGGYRCTRACVQRGACSVYCAGLM